MDRAGGANSDFHALLPVGEFRAEIVAEDLPAGYSIQTFSYGDTDLLQNPFVITAGEPSELRIGFSVMP